MKKKKLAALGFIVALVCAQFLSARAAAQRTGSSTVDFVRDIQPILQILLSMCGPTQLGAGLRLDLRDPALAK
jgi:hypothetical protein